MKKTFKNTIISIAAVLGTFLIVGQTLAKDTKVQEKKMSETTVIISTSKGDIKVSLNAAKAPITVKNFLAYVDKAFYNGTIFHRVIPNFMVQGGGFTPDMQQKKNDAPIKIESDNGLKNDRGTLAMARTSDPNSATSQFFINHKDNDFLNYKNPSQSGIGYAVFGVVTAGMDVVDAIAAVPTGPQDVPKETITIKEIRRK